MTRLKGFTVPTFSVNIIKVVMSIRMGWIIVMGETISVCRILTRKYHGAFQLGDLVVDG
jgi:hypothetical protein